ncbi:MAG: NADP-dependent malic enzyme [Candidatus Absconditabacteria bacterium]
MDYNTKSLEKHEYYKGKIQVISKVPLDNKDDLSTYYTPGVAQPCREIHNDESLAYKYTWKGNSVAVVSDGTAVLGLGNIGGIAGLPVMEGKAILFKYFGGVDAVPIVLKTQDPDEIINLVENISPTFGGINLEDISAPNCFYIEEELKKRLNIPVFHDDQHGTAIVVLAGIINACRLTGKKTQNLKIVISGSGAAGIAIANILWNYGVGSIIMTDSKGVINSNRNDLNKYKKQIAAYNEDNLGGTLKDVLPGADVFVGVSKPNLLDSKDVSMMADKAVVFALANPNPEILPDDAKLGGAYIVATGRSDFPNQVNNLLAFPGIFRGALDARISQIEEKHKLAAAIALADYVTDLTVDNILPSPLDMKVAYVIASAVRNA